MDKLLPVMMDVVRLCVGHVGAPNGYRVGVCHTRAGGADQWTVWAVADEGGIMGEATRPFPIPRDKWGLFALVKGAMREAVDKTTGHLGG